MGRSLPAPLPAVSLNAAVACPWDREPDMDDLLVGAPDIRLAESYSGSAYLLLGSGLF